MKKQEEWIDARIDDSYVRQKTIVIIRTKVMGRKADLPRMFFHKKSVFNQNGFTYNVFI
jgi:hypothetical protein